MQSVSNDTALLGVCPSSPMLQGWLAVAPDASPTVGGFLFVTVASLAVGMTLSAIRWSLIDTIHGLTGLPAPVLDFAGLGEKVGAYVLLIEIHYRHYQFYANMLIALAVAYVAYRARLGGHAIGWVDLGVLMLEAVFFVTSRDTLRKYYTRTQHLLAGHSG
jgi:hypothetical protein